MQNFLVNLGGVFMLIGLLVRLMGKQESDRRAAIIMYWAGLGMVVLTIAQKVIK